jgi:hypothetical protein
MGLLDNAPQSTPKVEDLVGEGKKYTTVEEMVADFTKKDTMLTEALNKAKELETDLRARENLSELSETLMKRVQRIEEPMEPTRRELEPDQHKVQTPDLKSEIAKVLAETRSAERREANIDKAKSSLKELYGSDYRNVLAKVSATLGLSEKFLDDMAAQSPDGFIQTVKTVQAPDGNPLVAPPQNSIDVSKNGKSTVRKNWAYYQELMKKDRPLFLSAKVQVEMDREAQEQGAAFYQ